MDAGHASVPTGTVSDDSVMVDIEPSRIRVVSTGHHLLRGGRPPYPNSLTSREMDSLIAICDTLLPSIHISGQEDKSLRTFYRTSASMNKTPEYTGGFMTGRLQHPLIWLLRTALWFLSTWYGTFVLCGRASLSTHFPYFQCFSQISEHRREEILYAWSISYFGLLRMLFKSLKFLTLLIFFTQANEKNENPSWEALGYVGPDPDFVSPAKSSTDNTSPAAPAGAVETEQKQRQQHEEDHFGPLHKAIINSQNPRPIIYESLQKQGFAVTLPQPTPGGSRIIHCDALVIGSGSGGGVVAGVIAKSGYKVLVLEKGNYYARRNLSLLEGPTMDQMYEGGGLLATDDLGVVVLAGSAVGGGSAINWSASIPTPAHVTAEWCNRLELEVFESEVYARALGAVCERMGVQDGIEEEGLNNAILRRGCQQLGYPVHNIPRNSPPDHYCGWCCFGCKDGRKKGTQETWLVDMADSGNGAIIPGCKALKVLYKYERKKKKKVATGAIFEIGSGPGKGVYVVKSKVTVVACGALGTPGLLKRSGLKNRNIGKHLHLHPTVMAWGYFPNEEDAEEEEEEEEKKKRRRRRRRSYEGGIMTAMSTVVGNMETTGYGAVIQTPALHPGMFSALMPWISGKDMKERMSRFSRTAHIFALARDEGEGQVMSSSSSSSLSYRLRREDEEKLKKGLEKALRILAWAGAEEIGTHHCGGRRLNVKSASVNELERFVVEESGRGLRDLSTPICSAHQMGSCRMGVDPKDSAVNPRGESWEVEGLFVADSSVFPTALGVNPMLTVQALAYCTAQSIVEVLSRKRDTNRLTNITASASASSTSPP